MGSAGGPLGGAAPEWSAWTPLVTAVDIAPKTPGVYMARRTGAVDIVYVGMAGERRGEGLSGRLGIYASGKAIASGLGEAIFDRALADEAWLVERLAEVRAGQPRRAKDWGKAALAWADLEVRWTITPDRDAARILEREVMRALPQTSLWNRRR